MRKLLRQFLATTFAWAIICQLSIYVSAEDDAFREATGLYQQAKWQRAAEIFAESANDVSNSANRSTASFYWGECLMQLGDYAAAREQYGIVLELQKDGPQAKRALFRAGEAAWFSGDKIDAEKLLTQYVEQPTQGDSAAFAHTYLGDLASAAADYDRAIASYRAALKHSTESTPENAARLGLAKALLALGKTQEVSTTLSQLLDSKDHATAAAASLLLGRSQYDSGDFDAALATFREIQSPSTDSNIAQRSRLAAGWSLWKLQRFAEIKEELQPLADDQQWMVEYRYLTGMASYAQRDWPAAIKHLTLAANGEDNHANRDAILFYLGESCSRAKQYKPATNWFRQLIDRYPESKWADDAQWELARIAKSNPSGEEHQAVANVLREPSPVSNFTADLPETGGNILRVREAMPTDELLDEAVGLERDGRYDPALAAYHELLNTYSPGNAHEEALKRTARLHAKLAQYPSAKQLYEQHLATYPESKSRAEMLAELAWLEVRLENREGAAKYFSKLHAKFPQSAQAAEAAYWLALEWADEEESDQAQQYVDWLLEHHANSTTKPLRKLWEQAVCLKCQLAATDNDWQTILDLLGKVGNQLNDEPARTRAAFWLAEAEFRTGNYDQARIAFEKLRLQVAGVAEPWVAMVPLRRAQLAARRQQWTKTLKRLDELDQKHAQFELDYEADYLRGRALAGRAEMSAARNAYYRVLANPKSKDTETAAMAQWMIGETYFHQYDFARAREIYLKVIDQHTQPEWQARAALQAGKCWELEGHWDKAKILYSTALKKWSGSESEEKLQARMKWADSQVTKRR
ncbi:MAG: tetratricopeptide repeat protein [Planctomycetes bacterium]|nr:tetratricopeptide repeat protein [Planctomycetota bacterium]